MARRTQSKILITGYTDHMEGDNTDLSLRRADAVRAEMLRQGVASEKIAITAQGLARPTGLSLEGVDRRAVIDIPCE
jgi:outer membrane protein OmpA-like peptidoglycan-associated protein